MLAIFRNAAIGHKSSVCGWWETNRCKASEKKAKTDRQSNRGYEQWLKIKKKKKKGSKYRTKQKEEKKTKRKRKGKGKGKRVQ